MGTKKCFLCFETHVFHSHELLSTRRWAIDSDGVVRLVEISPVVKVVLLAMCFLVFALCLVGCNSRWDLSLSDHDPVLFGTCNQVQLSIYRFTFQVFSSKWFSAFNSIKLCGDFPPNRSGIYRTVLHTVVVQKTGILQSVDLLNVMQLMHILSRFKQDTYSSLWLLTFKRHNFTDQLVSWICTSQTFGGRFKRDLPFINKTSLSAVVLDRYDLKWILRNFYPSFHLNYRLLYGIFNVCYPGGLNMLLFS